MQVIFETPGGVSSLPLQQEMFYPAAPYDDYDDYHTGGTVPHHRPSANDPGFYRGEIQLDSMSRGRSRGGAYPGDQETRFM